MAETGDISRCVFCKIARGNDPSTELLFEVSLDSWAPLGFQEINENDTIYSLFLHLFIRMKVLLHSGISSPQHLTTI